MAAGAWTANAGTRTKILDGTFDFDSDTFKVALFNSSWVTTTQTYSTTNELSTANGYTQGGLDIGTLELTGTTTVKITETGTTIEWTASSGSIVARYAVLYDDTAASNDIVCYCLLDSTPADVTVTDGNTLTITPHASGIISLS